MVDVAVAEVVVQLPVHALSEPLAILQLAMEAHVRLRDYA
jgi:hypothetical protein